MDLTSANLAVLLASLDDDGDFDMLDDQLSVADEVLSISQVSVDTTRPHFRTRRRERLQPQYQSHATVQAAKRDGVFVLSRGVSKTRYICYYNSLAFVFEEDQRILVTVWEVDQSSWSRQKQAVFLWWKIHTRFGKLDSVDNVNELREILPTLEQYGFNFGVWPARLPILCLFARRNLHQCVGYLLEIGAPSRVVNHSNDSPLQMAVRVGGLESVHLLLSAGADANVTNNKNYNSLHKCSYNLMSARLVSA